MHTKVISLWIVTMLLFSSAVFYLSSRNQQVKGVNEVVKLAEASEISSSSIFSISVKKRSLAKKSAKSSSETASFSSFYSYSSYSEVSFSSYSSSSFALDARLENIRKMLKKTEKTECDKKIDQIIKEYKELEFLYKMEVVESGAPYISPGEGEETRNITNFSCEKKIGILQNEYSKLQLLYLTVLSKNLKTTSVSPISVAPVCIYKVGADTSCT